jgi:serine/threonine-protein kinase RsbW
VSAKQVRIHFEGMPESLVLVRAALRGLGQEAELSPKAIGEIELCVTEAANNCIEHALANRAERDVRIDWVVYPDRLELAVCDHGSTLQPELLARADESLLEIDPADPRTLRIGGRGLALIKTLMDEVSYSTENGWNRLVMVLRRPPPDSD